ncbi:MAG TPA: hypothetical protein VLK85_33805 [Ramlibacter sp.]|nr:hypothetical protein [Ramlibacter sp.]
MDLIEEEFRLFPFDAPGRLLQRREELLLAEPLRGPGPPREYAPLPVAHFSPRYEAGPFTPPRAVVESEHVRVEWQTMDARQPFYHRNCGVDELSYQVDGDRTVITEWGSVDVEPGDFTRLPDGVAHDNLGRRDIHLLFYVPGPAVQLLPSSRRAEVRIPPFPGWQPATINELVTQGLAGPGQDQVMAPADEQLLLEHARSHEGRLAVVRPEARSEGVTWVYRATEIMVGHAYASRCAGRRYVRHGNADEMQYQLAGKRMLLTQRGCVELVPGDVICIPRGVAFTSVHDEGSTHLVVASTRHLPLVAPATRTAKRLAPDELRSLPGR